MPDTNDDDLLKWAEGLSVKSAKTFGKKVLSQPEIEDVLREAGWDEKHIPKVSAIAMAESSGNPQAYNPGVGPGGRPTREKSVGILQVNTLAHPEYDAEKLKDPVYNAKAAKAIFDREGLRAWGAYTDGRYRKYYRGVPVTPPVDETSVWNDVDSLLGDNKGGQPTAPTVPIGAIVKSPVPEAPPTIDAQAQSAVDTTSPKAAVLLTDPKQTVNTTGLKKVQTPQGALLVNPAKARALGVKNYLRPSPKDVAKLIGKVENLPDTTQGPAVLTTDAQGNELSASRVTSPQTAQMQAQHDAMSYPQAANTQVVDAQDVVKKREDDALRQQQITTLGHPIETLGGLESTPVDETIPPPPPLAVPHPDAVLGEQLAPLVKKQIKAAQPKTQPAKPTHQASKLQPNQFAVATTPEERKADTGGDEVVSVDTSDAKGDIGVDAATKALTRLSGKYPELTPDIIKGYAQKYAGTQTEKGPIDVHISRKELAALIGDKTVKERYAQDIAQANVEQDNPDLRVGAKWTQVDADRINETFGPEIGAAVGGIIGSGGRIARKIAGAIRPINTSAYEYMKEVADTSSGLEAKTGDQSGGYRGIADQIIKIGAGAPGDLSSLYLLSRLPGGIMTAMALDKGLEASGAGKNLAEIGKQAGKGLAEGAVFAAAPFIGKLGQWSVSSAFKAATAGKIARELTTIGTIGLGTAQIEKSFGASDEEALRSGLVNAAFHVGNLAYGKVFRARNAEGKTVNAAVTPDGEVKLLKGQTEKPDVEVFVDTKKASDGTYVATGDKSPVRTKEAPISAGNRGNRLETSAEPAQLQERNPFRVESADPAAVQRASVDTRTRKVADVLKSGALDIDGLQKATKYNRTNVSAAIDTLIQARIVEVLPDNRVQLIKDISEAAKERPLYEKYTQPAAKPSAPVPSQPAPVAKTENVPAPKPIPSAPPKVEAPTETVPDTSAYENLPQQKPQAVEPEKPKAKVVYAERPDTAKTLNVFTERGTKASIEPKVVDSSDILTSLDKGFPEEFQPRDRSRVASKAQIAKIASDLNPEFLGDSPKAGDGRPLVVPVQIGDKTKYAVISGNGRTAGIREAYEAGNEGSKKYREFAKSKGGTTEKPIYVGVLDPKQVGDIAEFAREANESNVAQMSATEKARSDAARLTPDVMASFVPSEDGGIHTAANRDFTRAFLEGIGPSEAGAIIQPDGSLNQDGVNRVRNAIFAKAFGDTPQGHSAIQRMAESTSDSVKNTTTALLGMAPKLVAFKESIRQGARHKQLDVSKDLAAAVSAYAKLKGPDSAFKDLDEYISQGNLFGAETTPLQTRLMQVFDTHKRSPKAVRTIISNYLDAADAIGDPRQASMFGKNEVPSVESVLEGAIQAYERESGKAVQVATLYGDQGVQAKPVARPESSGAIAQPEVKETGTRTAPETVTPPPPPPTRFATTLPEPRPPETVNPIPRSVARSMVRREMAKEGSDVGEIAKSFGFTEAEVKNARPLGDKGRFGQTSHRIRRALHSPDNFNLLNKVARVVLPEARVNANNPLFGVQDSVNAILDAIAEEMNVPRSSHMSGADWIKYLNTNGDRLPLDAVNIINDAVAHQERWHQQRENFINDPELATVLERIGRISELGKLTGYKDLPMQDRKEILRIGRKYGTKGNEGDSGLSDTVIKETFDKALRRTLAGELEGRVDRPANTTAKSGTTQARSGETEEVDDDLLFNRLDDERNLVAAHNLSEANLKFADKMGGLALPSIAITRKDVGFSGFGEITLLADPSLIDPKNKVPVTDADMYSPRYPQQKIIVKHNALKDVWADVQSTWKKHFPDQREPASHYVFEAELADRGLEGLSRDDAFKTYALSQLGIDIPKTRDELYKVTSAHNEEIEDFASELIDKIGGEYKYFKGWTNSGNKRLGTYDLETVVKQIKSEMKTGEGWNYGAGNIRAANAKRFKTIAQIQKDRHRIVTAEQMEATKEQMNKKLLDLADEARSHYKYDKNAFGYYDQFTEALAEGAKNHNLRRTMEEYGFENLDYQPIISYLETLRNQPTEYFEAKPQRAVRLNEFTAAVVPDNISDKTRKILEKNGLEITEYKKSDPQDRIRAVEEAAGQSNILFTTLNDAYAQTDLFGNPVSVQTVQDSLFDLGNGNDIQSELEDAYGVKTADYIKSMQGSKNKKVAAVARELSDARKLVSAKGDGARTIVEDAADALDAFALAEHQKAPITLILQQQRLDAATLSDRAKGFAMYMSQGSFAPRFRDALSKLATDDNAVQAQTAWHGSPHTFDKFDISKIGTGEGAQVYGHGLYFTDKEAVADHYKKALAHKAAGRFEYKGESIDTVDPAKVISLPLRFWVDEYQKTKGIKNLFDVNERAMRRLSEATGDTDRGNLLRLVQNGRRMLSEVNSGVKYKVNLKPNEDEYLLWDKPLSEQSEKVKKAFQAETELEKDARREFLRNPANWQAGQILTMTRQMREGNEYTDLSGANLYRQMAGMGGLGSQTKASDYLKSLGIRGIKYLDGSSRSKGEGNYNYVIFDDADVEITEIHRRALDEEPKLKKHFRGFENLTTPQLIDQAKVSIDPDTGLLNLDNAQAVILMNKIVATAKKRAGAFIGAYLTPNNTALIGRSMVIARKRLFNAGDAESAVRLDRLINLYDKAAKGGDLAMSMNLPEFPASSKYTKQEELGHATNSRTGARSVFVDIAETPSIKKSLANLGPSYANISLTSQVDEVIAKSYRDDATDALGITEDEVWQNIEAFATAANEQGIDLAAYTEQIGKVSETGKRFAENESKRSQRNDADETGGTAVRSTRPEDTQGSRTGGTASGSQARTLGQDDRLGKLRRTELSTAGRNGIESLVSPTERSIIQHKAKNDKLANNLIDEIAFARLPKDAILSSFQRTKGVLTDLANVPRAIKASSDLSAAGRQGMILIPNNPILAAKAFWKQLKMVPPKIGARNFEKFKRDLDLHPYIELAEASKLHLSSLRGEDLNGREEAFMSQIMGDDRYFTSNKLEKPRQFLTFGVRASERAYVTMLDDLRINVFAKMAREIHQSNFRAGREDDPAQYEAAAKFVNYASGRGDLGKLNDLAPILNASFFSPRFWASRLQVMNPAFYAKLPPGARIPVLKNLLAFVGTFGAMMAMLKAAGFKVETGDEKNPDLMKLRLGNYTYDMSGGLLSHIRYIARMALAAKDAKTNKQAIGDMRYLTGRYLESKLAPIPSAAYHGYIGENFLGEPTSFKEEARDLVKPIMFENFRDAANADGTAGLVKMTPEFFGISTTRYKQADEIRGELMKEKAKLDESLTPEQKAADDPKYTPAQKENIRRLKLWRSQLDKTQKFAKED